MKILFKILLSLPSLIILYLLLSINYTLYYQPEYSDKGVNLDVKAQLNYLKTRRDDGAAQEMQRLFPEGLMFFECLYGLAWADFLSNNKVSPETFAEGVREIDKSIKSVNSDLAKSIFPENTYLEYGAFYSGWSGYLMGRKLEILPRDQRTEKDINAFKNNTDKIAKAIAASHSPYLESYHGGCWPADVTICIATLALHDRIFEQKYTAIIAHWIEKVKLRLDENGLTPHSANSFTGKPLEEARGSSQSLILSFLPEIDSAFSKAQFAFFKKLFIQKRLDLSGVREYPIGQEGNGDIDSGPVIWGIGSAATIVAHRACLKNGDYALAQEIRNEIEAFGFPKTNDSKKYFLKGYLDIADAFIAWTRAADENKISPGNSWWQVGFHLWSVVISGVSVLAVVWIWK